jgi:hypothetical protein
MALYSLWNTSNPWTFFFFCHRLLDFLHFRQKICQSVLNLDALMPWSLWLAGIRNHDVLDGSHSQWDKNRPYNYLR